MSRDPTLDFWNNRATLKARAGSDDIIAKGLEIEALARRLHDGLVLAEFGCGNGITAVELARRFSIVIHAYDFSAGMIKEARQNAEEAGLANRVRFEVADIRASPTLEPNFDVVYTERMLINLPDWETQARAIRAMADHLRPGGRLLLCENSRTGLDILNTFRRAAGLDAITPPWHNVYLDDEAMAALDVPCCHLEAVEAYSATYYFLSRVVNAWLARQEGREPAYDAPVNQLAMLLPSFGDCAQGKLWIWRRDAD